MDYLKEVKAKEAELQDMFKRMDADADVFHAEAYKMKGVDKKEVKGVYHITTMDALQYLAKAVARLTSVNRQVLVESEKLPGEKTSTIEHFIDDLQYEVDARLAAMGEPDAFTQHAELVCARGPIAEQNLLRIVDGELVADSRPIDTRWFTYDMTGPKLAWGCVQSTRSASDILKEYGVEIAGKASVVYDFWDGEAERVFIGNELRAENENPYKEPPFVLAFPSTTTALRDDNYIKRKGDSILHALRTADGQYWFDEKSFVASILKTQASETVAPALQAPSPPEGDYQSLPDGYPSGPGVMVQTKAPLQLVPRPDVRESTLRYAEIVNAILERGTFSAMDYGTIDLPLSAVAIATIQAGKNELLLPRLNCLASLFQASTKQKIRQFIQLAQSAELGEEGHRRLYTPADLDGKYVVKYRFFTSSQEQMASAAAICNQLGDHVSEEFKQEEVLRLQDPAGERAKIASERARKSDPVLDLYDQMRGFIKAQEASDDQLTKDENDIQARLVLARIVSILKQRKASETQPMPTNIEEGARVETKGAPGMPVFSSQQVKTQ